MKGESRNPGEDLPNQEKNQNWTIYWWEQGASYTKIREGSDQENGGLLRRGQTESGGKVNCGNENTAASLEQLTLHGSRDGPWPDPTRAYFWPAVKRPTRLRPGYFPTQPEEIFFDPKGKKLKNLTFLGEIFQIQTQTINGWPDPTWVKNFWPGPITTWKERQTNGSLFEKTITIL